MKTVVLKMEEDIYEKLTSFLKSIPKDKIQILEPNEIPFVDDAEQEEITMILKDPETKTYSKPKTFNL